MRGVDLNIGRAEADKLGNFLAQNRDNVIQEIIERRIGISGILRRPEVRPQAGTRKRYLRNSIRFVLQVRKFSRRERTKALELRDRAEATGSAFLLHALLVIPLSPKKSVEVKLAKPSDRRGHLALKRLATHLAIGDDLQTDALLQRDSFIDGAVFYFFELCRSDRSDRKVFLRCE